MNNSEANFPDERHNFRRKGLFLAVGALVAGGIITVSVMSKAKEAEYGYAEVQNRLPAVTAATESFLGTQYTAASSATAGIEESGCGPKGLDELVTGLRDCIVEGNIVYNVTNMPHFLQEMETTLSTSAGGAVELSDEVKLMEDYGEVEGEYASAYDYDEQRRIRSHWQAQLSCATDAEVSYQGICKVRLRWVFNFEPPRDDESDYAYYYG